MMKTKSELFLELWREARTRFSNQLAGLTPGDLQKTLSPSPNSAGFLIRHIGEVEMLFAKNVFGMAGVQVHAKTVIAKQDTGEWTDLDALLKFTEESAAVLADILAKKEEADWDATISTKEFGTKTKAEALGRIVSHTAYHAGQLAMVLKYGMVN